MTNDLNAPIDCEAVRDEMPGLLYDDIDPGARSVVEEHLAQCAACRAELEADRATLRCLDEWSVESPPAAGISSFSIQTSRRLGWLRPVLVGAVAAAVAFAALGAIGADARYGDGALILTIGRAMAESDDGRPFSNGLNAARAVTREELDERLSRIAEALAIDLEDLGRRQERRRVVLAQVVDVELDRDWRRQARLVEILVARYESESQWTRDAFDEMWTRIDSFVSGVDGSQGPPSETANPGKELG